MTLNNYSFSLLMVMSFSLHATEITTSNESNPHFYAGGKLGWGHTDNACFNDVNQCDNDALGGGVYLGYQFLPWFALEADATDYGNYKGYYQDSIIKNKIRSIGLSTVFQYNITNDWAAYTRLGASILDVNQTYFLDVNQSYLSNKDESSRDWNFVSAIGLKYQFNPQWSLRTEYQFINNVGNTNTQQTDLHFTSIGLSYHFGQGKAISAIKPEISVIKAERQTILPVVAETYTFSESHFMAVFKAYSTTFTPSPQLKSMLISMKNKNIQNIVISAYTDSYGSHKLNQDLSNQRAESVRNYLIDQGINAKHIRAIGYGATNFIATNKTIEGRNKNRRIEMTITTKTLDNGNN